MELSENMIKMLFDTLKASIDKNEQTLDKSVDAQINHMNYMKPKVEKIEENSTKSLKILGTLSKKVTTMILVVAIAFTLMTSAYFIARAVSDSMPHTQQKIESKE